MTPTTLGWIRSEGLRMHASLRHRVISLYRPPRPLPCWLHSLWYWLVNHFARLEVIAEVEGDCNEASAHLALLGVKARPLEAVGHLCARVRVRDLETMVTSGWVRRVWLDRPIEASLDRAITSTGAVRASRELTGAGVTIAFVDTGIYPHPDLRTRLVGWIDLVRGRLNPYDDNGHGTHVAGCAAGDGSSSGGRYRGMAPRALLVGVKVLDRLGAGRLSVMLTGIDWVIRNRARYAIRILSLSLGGRAMGHAADDPLAIAVERAWQAGLTVVTAAGNSGPESGTIASPGIAPSVITVGAMDDRESARRADDVLAPFSSRGPTVEGRVKPDLLAPGVGITSLRAPRSLIDKQQPESRVGEWYATLSGTSMATPIVAGLVALLLEKEPELEPDGVKARLMETAEDWGLQPTEQGAGYLDADGAIWPDG
ncbi:MAG TPA: S8 family peptidase [Symbiobacteriaceae bacterium]|nr:S8 family peptidase [Symbiobacteriaceae bacterium]